MSDTYDKIVKYFDGTNLEEVMVSEYKGANKSKMYIVKRGLQYIHVIKNGDNDYTASLHLLDMCSGEKRRISADFREQSIKDVLDPIMPSFQSS